MSERFGRADRAAAECVPCRIGDVQEFILAHYLCKRPAVVVLALMMKLRGEPVGACVFALPPKQTAKRYGGETWELARLYVKDEVPSNAETWFIGAAVRYIKRHHSSVCYLVSYADPAAKHKGTIYRAANWLSDGMTDQERRTLRSNYRANGRTYGRRAHAPGRVTAVRRGPKFRFMLPLKRRRGGKG